MAKTIKFNLICDGKPIRTLEDLQENFSVEDILEYYNNHLLHRWLSVRGYADELKKVEDIDETEVLQLVRKLIQVFGVETDENVITQNTYFLEYQKERRENISKLLEQDRLATYQVEEYWDSYQKIVQNIEDNKDDINIIRASIREIDENYRRAFELDHRFLFYRLTENAPLAIFVMLSRPKMRGAYLPSEDMVGIDQYIEEDRKEMYRSIGHLMMKKGLEEILGDNLREFSGDTEGYWKDLEGKDKKCMVLKMESGTFVRPAGVKDGDLGVEDINNRFVILDGLDYKSNYVSKKLLYMEV